MTNGTDHADVSVANRTRLSALKVAELQELAASLGIVGASKRRKGDLVDLISAHQNADVALDDSSEAPSFEAPVAEQADPVGAPPVVTEPDEAAQPEPADDPVEAPVADAAAEVAEVGIKARGPLAALGAALPPGW